MIQIENRKRKYRNTDQRKKAAFCGSGFLDSKTIRKSMKLTKQIIQRREENRTVFLRQFEKGGERDG